MGKGSRRTKLDIMAYERDGFSCVECGKKEGIEAHHIIPSVEEISNLITLCHSCHKKKHNMSGCFKRGYDPRRSLEGLAIGHELMRRKIRTIYYNRHTGEWLKTKHAKV